MGKWNLFWKTNSGKNCYEFIIFISPEIIIKYTKIEALHHKWEKADVIELGVELLEETIQSINKNGNFLMIEYDFEILRRMKNVRV